MSWAISLRVFIRVSCDESVNPAFKKQRDKSEWRRLGSLLPPTRSCMSYTFVVDMPKMSPEILILVYELDACGCERIFRYCFHFLRQLLVELGERRCGRRFLCCSQSKKAMTCRRRRLSPRTNFTLAFFAFRNVQHKSVTAVYRCRRRS